MNALNLQAAPTRMIGGAIGSARHRGLAVTEPRSQAAWVGLASLVALHAGAGLLMQRAPAAALLHALASVLAGLMVALFARQPHYIVWAVCYIAGGDVLWRMCGGAVLWELSKYAIAAICFCGLVRMKQYRLPPTAVFYLLLLIPSALVTVFEVADVDLLRGRLSTFLSGPLALAACVSFFSNCTLTRRDAGRAVLALILPICGVFFIASYGTFSHRIAFGTSSIHAASGGYGPNQVSAMLGLGALALLLYLVGDAMGIGRKVLIAALVVGFLGQSALTLSRGGIYAAFGAFVPALLIHLGNRQTAKRATLVVVLFGLLGAFVIFPFLDSYTGGALAARYQEKGMTGRESLMALDLGIWLSNPLYGVGVGLSQFRHPLINGQYVMNHNEFTRMLAEHGLFGLGATLLLGVIALQRIRAAKGAAEKARVTALLTWGALFLFVNGTRISAAPFAFGLAMLRTEK